MLNYVTHTSEVKFDQHTQGIDYLTDEIKIK